MKHYYFLIIFSLFSITLQAQVGIGTTNPSPASMLEVSGTSDGGATYKGFMPPRVPDIAARDNINAGYDDVGLIVFVINTGSLQIWDGDSWENVTQITIATPEIWINEIHYNNEATDTGEAIEIAGEAGTDLTDYQLILYNGVNGLEYNTVLLTGMLTNQSNGYGFSTITFSTNGIQNGNPDGIALIKISTGSVIQFLSYGGTFTAVDGPAAGRLSVDIGVSENGSTVVGTSLQLVGSGNEYIDFTWSEDVPETFNTVNTGQTMN